MLFTATKPVLLTYPRCILLALTFLAATLLYGGREILLLHEAVVGAGYVGVFATGMLYSYGFTAAPATAILLIAADGVNPVAASLIGGVGGLISDLVIFRFLRTSLSSEIKRLARERPIRRLRKAIPKYMRKPLIPILAGLIIASPLPDEIGVFLLASTGISLRLFSLEDYLLSTVGIFLILAAGTVL